MEMNKQTNSMKIMLVLSMIAVMQATAANIGSQYTPITADALAIPLHGNPQNAPIIVDVVYNPLCGDSYQFDNNILRKLQEQLPSEVRSKIQFQLLLQPLPYLIPSFKVIQAILYAADNSNNGVSLFRYFVDNIQKWNANRLAYTTISEYLDELAEKASELAQIDQADIRNQLKRGSKYDLKTRVVYKNAVGAKRNGATPSVFINGVKVDNSDALSLEDWIKLFSKLAQQ